MAAKRTPSSALEQCLPRLRALADATRVRLVRTLTAGESTVTALAETLGVTIYNTSRHLKVLKDAGLVEMEVRAQQRIYRLSAPILLELRRNRNVLELGCCSFRLEEATA